MSLLSWMFVNPEMHDLEKSFVHTNEDPKTGAPTEDPKPVGWRTSILGSNGWSSWICWNAEGESSLTRDEVEKFRATKHTRIEPLFTHPPSEAS